RNRLADRDRELRDAAAPRGMDLVLHLHRLHDAQHLARLDLVAFGNLDREDRALHRADDGVSPGARGPPRTGTLAAPACELHEAWLRAQDANLEAAPVHLDRTHGLVQRRAVGGGTSYRPAVLELRCTRGQKLRLDDAVARIALDEARV